MIAERTPAGDLYTRLQDYVDQLGSRVAATSADANRTSDAADSGFPRIRIDESREEIEPLALPDDWQETDLEEAGVR